MIQMHFPRQSTDIAGFLQGFGDRLYIRWTYLPILPQAIGDRIASSQKTPARRRAQRTLCKRMRAQHALTGQLI